MRHYWLCGPCYEEYNFAFPSGGGVALEAKGKTEQFTGQSREFLFGDVVFDPEQIEQSRGATPREAEFEGSALKEPGRRT